LAVLTDLFAQHGPPAHIRSDNGAESTAIAVCSWLGRIGVITLYIEPGSPWDISSVDAERRNFLPATAVIESVTADHVGIDCPACVRGSFIRHGSNPRFRLSFLAVELFLKVRVQNHLFLQGLHCIAAVQANEFFGGGLQNCLLPSIKRDNVVHG
jgi:hypothetical protein